MGIGERIAAKRSAERRLLEIAEWGEDEPLQLYISALTCHDVDKIQRKHKDFLTNMSVGAMVDLIIQKAEDKAGEKVFTLEDRPFLMREPVTLISRIAGEMFATVIPIGEQGND